MVGLCSTFDGFDLSIDLRLHLYQDEMARCFFNETGIAVINKIRKLEIFANDQASNSWEWLEHADNLISLAIREHDNYNIDDIARILKIKRLAQQVKILKLEWIPLSSEISSIIRTYQILKSFFCDTYSKFHDINLSFLSLPNKLFKSLRDFTIFLKKDADFFGSLQGAFEHLEHLTIIIRDEWNFIDDRCDIRAHFPKIKSIQVNQCGDKMYEDIRESTKLATNIHLDEPEGVTSLKIDQDCFIVLIIILANHQDGRDSKIRNLKVFSGDEELKVRMPYY